MQNVALRDIAFEVCEYFKLSKADLFGKSRTKQHAHPRQVAFYLAYRLTKRSTTQIGKYFNRDHTTVMHGERKIDEKLKDIDLNFDITQAINTITRNLTDKAPDFFVFSYRFNPVVVNLHPIEIK